MTEPKLYVVVIGDWNVIEDPRPFEIIDEPLVLREPGPPMQPNVWYHVHSRMGTNGIPQRTVKATNRAIRRGR
jgi:hypothetical protein